MRKRVSILASVVFAMACLTGHLESRAGQYEDGVKRLAQRDYQGAADALRKFCKDSPKDPRRAKALIAFADALLGAGQPLEATRVYENFIKDYPNDAQQALARVRLSRCYEARGEYLKTISVTKEYLKRFHRAKDQWEQRWRLAGLYDSKVGRHKDAMRELKTLLDKLPNDPRNAQVYWKIAHLYKGRLRDPKNALAQFRVVVDKYPKDKLAAGAQAEVAHLCEDGGLRDWALAVTEYKKYIKTYADPKAAAAKWERIAYLYRDRMRRYEKAVEAYDAALKLAPSARLAWERVVAIERAGDKNKMMAAYRSLIAKYPNTGQAHNAYRGLWRRQWELGQKNEAVVTLEKILTLHPTSAEDRYELAHRHREMQQWDKAIAQYTKITQLHPGWPNGDVYVYLTASYLGKKNAAGAEKMLRAAMAEYPRNTDIYVKCLWELGANVYEAQLKNYPKAVECFREILARFPTYGNYPTTNYATKHIIECYRALKKIDAAAAEIEKLAALYPNTHNLRCALAEVVKMYNAEKQPQKAVACGEKVVAALDYDWGAAWTCLWMGDAYGELKKSPEQLMAYAKLDRFRADRNYRGMHGEIDKRRKEVLPALLAAETRTAEKLASWHFKRDPKEEGEEGKWFEGNVDASWQKKSSGADWGDYDGHGWYVTKTKATGGEGNYAIAFESVDDEAWVYVDGKIVKHNSGAKPFSFTFTTEKEEGDIVIAVHVHDKKAKGGILGACTITKPKVPKGVEKFRAGLAYHALGKIDRAMELYRKYLEEKPDATEPVVQFQNAYYERKGNLEGIQKNAPKRPTVIYLHRLARMYAGQKQMDKAIECYQNAKKMVRPSSPSSMYTQLRLAQIYESYKKWDQAAQEYKLLLLKLRREKSPATDIYQRHVVWMAADYNRWRNAPKAREMAGAFNDPATQYWHRTLADLNYDYSPQSYGKALEHYKTCYEKFPLADSDMWHCVSRYHDCLMRVKKYGDAATVAQDWLKKYPKHRHVPWMLYKLAEATRSAGQGQESLAIYKDIQAKYPRHDAARHAVSQVVNSLTGPDRLAMLEKWVKDNARDQRAAEMYWQLGQKLEPEKDGIGKAIACYQKVWKDYRGKWAENMYAADRLAERLRGQKKHKEALEVYQQVTDHFGGSGHQQVKTAWWRVMEYYGKRVFFDVNVDSTYAGYTPARVINGNTNGNYGNSGYSWLSLEKPEEHWVECALLGSEKVDKVAVYWGNANQLPQAYKIQYWDGKQYVDFPESKDWRVAKAVGCVVRVKPVTTAKVRVVQKLAGGSKDRPQLMQVAEVRVYRDLPDKNFDRLVEHAERMIRTYRGQYESFYARRSLAYAYQDRGRFLDADISLQEAVFESPRNHGWFWDRTVETATAKMNEERYGEAAAILKTLLELNPRYRQDQRKNAEKLMGTALSKSGVHFAVIDPKAPEAGLLWGDVFASGGEAKLAFQKYLENKDIFSQFQHKLSPEYIEIVVTNLLDMKEIRQAIDICRRFDMQHRKDKHISASAKARVQLLLGDCYYRDERYDIARDEYMTVVNLYKGAPEAIEARFKVGETLMAQKIYVKAEEEFKNLAKTTDENVLARAEFMLGVLYNTRGEKKAAEAQFKKVLALTPQDETADEIILRLGSVYLDTEKYKEALDTLRLIGAYSKDPKRFIEPGQTLRIRLSDRDLNVTKGTADVPIEVRTSDGDKEITFLQKSEIGEALFIAQIDTELGDPKPEDKKLQIGGNSVITYKYEDKFAEDYHIEQDEVPRKIRVAADASLKASATEIKDEEEMTDIVPGLPGDETRTGLRLFRNESEVKPGNPAYTRVIDFDRDVTGEQDKVKVLVSASSGDTVELALTETEPHTGKFDGSVQTGQRPPDTTSSDFAEGHEPRYAIDGNPKATHCWMGEMDDRVPKWLAVDLKEVRPVKKIVWDRGAGYDPKEERKLLRYTIEVSRDKTTWMPIAIFPEKSALLTGVKVKWAPDSGRDFRSGPAKMLQGNGNITERWIGLPKQPDYIIDLDLGQNTQIEQTVLKNHDGSHEVKTYTLYVEKETGLYPGEFRDMDGWRQIHTKTLDKPAVDTAYFGETKPKEGETAKPHEPIVARYLRLYVPAYFGDQPEIGEFEIFPHMAFNMEDAKEGVGATFTFPAVQARHVRLLVREYTNDAPAIAHLAIYGEGEKQIVPSGIDIHKLATNNILELSPGDTITVAYNDEVNIDPGEPKMYTASLKATYYNGHIKAIKHEWYEDERGNRNVVDHLLKRLEIGDRFIVTIVDYDIDKTDAIDKLEFTVKTASGQEETYDARETEPYSGVFTKEVDTSAEPKPKCLVLKDGDVIELSYIDGENTNPGNKIARTATIEVVQPTDGKVRIATRGRADRADELQVKLLSLEEPLVVEVLDKDMAHHTGNKVTVELRTEPGGDTAKIECRVGGQQQGGGRGYLAQLSASNIALERGLFSGQIDLALGDKDSPGSKVEAARFEEVDLGRRRDVSETPVLNVMGSDTIIVTYIDEQNSKAAEITREAKARMITTGSIGIYDDEYEDPLPVVHLGDKLYLKVEDFDSDTSGDRDHAAVVIESSLGDKLTLKLVETLKHSGIFTAPVEMTQGAKADPTNDVFETDFGNKITVTYVDKASVESKEEPVDRTAETEVVVGCDGLLLAFGKKYPDKDMAVETEFKIGECFFHLGKEHMGAKKKELGAEELAEGQRIIDELLQYFPESKIFDESIYLLGNFAQERNDYHDAVKVYQRVTHDFPNSPVAPEAQYKIAMCHEKLGDFDDACEEYVRLAYRFPHSPLVSDAMIRIGLYFFEKKDYESAVQVFGRFVAKFPGHKSVEKVCFKMGLCYILSERYMEGGDHFKDFIEKYAESDLKPAALYWAGDSYLKGNNALKAYQMFKRVIWDFPDSKWAKYARGRLTAPVFDRIAEME